MTENRIIAQHFQDLLAADPDGIHSAVAGTGAILEVTTNITNPDYARNISITTTNVVVPSGSIIITGVIRGVSDTESIVIIPGGIAYGNKAFDTVTMITIPIGVTAADTVTVGFSDKIGLSSPIDYVYSVFKKKINNIDVTSELSGKVSAVYYTVDCSPIVSNKDMELRYISSEIILTVVSAAISIEEVLGYLNNYFVYTHAPNVYIDFDAATKKITLATIGEIFSSYALDIKVNQYIRIEGSRLNDGVYKVTVVATNSVIVDATLIDEVSDEDLDYVTIYELAIPQKLLSIITEMIAWTGTDNVKSESLGPHSITYDKPSNVFTSFAGRIKRWKKVGWR